ncbi:MAG: hypothetical protein CMP73_04315 [Flavobacteriales bacterium]|nr:hypothetical protein [Flavobacteriales bacterium]
MKKIFLILLCLFNYSNNIYSQKNTNLNLQQYEDTLEILANNIMNLASEEDKKEENKLFIKNLKKALEKKKSYKYPFNSLKTIAKLKSKDDKIRIFNWILKKDDSKYEYYAIVHFYNKNEKKYEIIELNNQSSNIINPEQAELNAENWFGCLYYELIEVKHNNKKFYTLLGWDNHDNFSTKKIIEILYFDANHDIKFGYPKFSHDNKSKKRIILQFDKKTATTLRYHKSENRIVFNNLVPSRKDLEGLKEYYIPDGTYNHYKLNKDKWYFEANIDARNNNKIKKANKKPKRGLLPN